MHSWLRVAQRLGLTLSELKHLLETGPRRYKTFAIPKRNGGLRLIAQPSRELKRVQRAVIDEFLSGLPIHEAATAYRTGRNIRENALAHSHNVYILKTDFKNLFNSIKSEDLTAFCRRHNLLSFPDEQLYLIRALFWNPKGTSNLCLSVGAPSSPLLSNLLMYEFDQEVAEKCRATGVTYTRYADDITLSAIDLQALHEAKRTLEQSIASTRHPRLTINPSKTVLVSKKFRRTVTGLVLSNSGAVSLGRDQKRKLSARIHKYSLGLLDPSSASELAGHIAFAKSAEPEFYIRMQTKYGFEVIKRLCSAPKQPQRAKVSRERLSA